MLTLRIGEHLAVVVTRKKPHDHESSQVARAIFSQKSAASFFLDCKVFLSSNDVNRWEEKASLRRDTVGFQVIGVLEAQEIPAMKKVSLVATRKTRKALSTDDLLERQQSESARHRDNEGRISFASRSRSDFAPRSVAVFCRLGVFGLLKLSQMGRGYQRVGSGYSPEATISAPTKSGWKAPALRTTGSETTERMREISHASIFLL
jgi:hypothetical protein